MRPGGSIQGPWPSIVGPQQKDEHSRNILSKHTLVELSTRHSCSPCPLGAYYIHNTPRTQTALTGLISSTLGRHASKEARMTAVGCCVIQPAPANTHKHDCQEKLHRHKELKYNSQLIVDASALQVSGTHPKPHSPAVGWCTDLMHCDNCRQ